MKIDRRASAHEDKRITNVLFKHRDKVKQIPITKDARRDAYFEVKDVGEDWDETKLRIHGQALNRTKREREAITFEISASSNPGLSHYI